MIASTLPDLSEVLATVDETLAEFALAIKPHLTEADLAKMIAHRNWR